jgi:putative tryptophan/tyrosine transport system substrate-binding protein
MQRVSTPAHPGETSELLAGSPSGGRPIGRRLFLGSGLAIMLLPRRLSAQGHAPTVRIGWITAQRLAGVAPYLEALRAGLADRGYVEGGNLAIEYRFGDDSLESVPDLAADLLRHRVALIVAQGAAVPAIAKLGLPVPVVYAFSGDPTSAGMADSLARPLGNMTGLTFMAAELNGKRLELLRELIPDLRRVAVLGSPQHPGVDLERAANEHAAVRLGLSITYFPTRTRDDLADAFAAMDAARPQAISLLPDAFTVQNRQTIVDFAMHRRIPVISGWAMFAQSGAVCSYGPRLTESFRRLAYFVDRILKGAKPAHLPIEQPTHFELVLNLRAGSALGLEIPSSLIARADEIIE